MTEYSFKKHPITDAERKWLEEIAAAPHFDARIAKVKLFDILPEDFDHGKIDKRILSHGMLTPLGRWYLNHDDPLLTSIDKVVTTVRRMILAKPGISQIETKEIGQKCGLDTKVLTQTIHELGKLGRFYSGASRSEEYGYLFIELQDESVYDEYLRYKGLEDLLEKFGASGFSMGTDQARHSGSRSPS